MEAKKVQKVLVLLDMNETLILRKRFSIKCGFPPNIDGTKKIYFRPGYAEFLEKLLLNPKAVVGIYSSMILANIDKCISGMLKHPKLVPYKDKITLFFGRKYNVYDPEGKKRTDTMRDLRRIWKNPRCKGSFNALNTVMIDNEARKVRTCKENSIIVDSFMAEHLIDGKPNNHFYLEQLSEYIKKLLDECDKDIRVQMKDKPFVIDEKGYNTIDPELAAESAVKRKPAAVKPTVGIVEQMESLSIQPKDKE